MGTDEAETAPERAEVGRARRFLLLWGMLALAMFVIAGVLTAVVAHVSIPGSDFQPIGLYGSYNGRATGWIYYERRRTSSDFLVYYPARTSFVALPYGTLTSCSVGDRVKTTMPASKIEHLAYEGHAFYLVDVSNAPGGVATDGILRCDIAFDAHRESFTGFSMDMWYLPKLPRAGVPIATLNFSAIIEGAEHMQVFGGRSTSLSGVDLTPDDEAVVKYTDVYRGALRDVFLVLIGAFVALGAAMALEAIRPYVEARAHAAQD